MTGQTNRRIIIFSLGAVIVPLVVFPSRLGTDIARASLVNALYELVYYGVVIFIFHRSTTLLRLIQGAGVCLIYRLALGAVFGLLLAAVYSLQTRVSLTLGMSGYLPAILFQIALAPFVLKPVVDQLYGDEPVRRRAAPPIQTDTRAEFVRPAHVPVKPKAAPEAPKVPAFAAARKPDSAAYHRSADSMRELNGFDRAVYYLGEHSAVQLATIVDSEGLTLGSFKRGQVRPEDWAPLALLVVGESGQVLERGNLDGLEKVDLILKDKRLVVARPEGLYLMVLAERHDDDLLNIRINQALEMINKFVAERYGNKLHPNAERVHVPSA
ncbi:MAG: hypothetical protein AB1772_04600 [Candidatus Zixiibacteriota bacterium]